MDPTVFQQWASLGLGGLLIALVGWSIFKLIDAWVQLSAERSVENTRLKQEINDLVKENKELIRKLYDDRKP